MLNWLIVIWPPAVGWTSPAVGPWTVKVETEYCVVKVTTTALPATARLGGGVTVIVLPETLNCEVVRVWPATVTETIEAGVGLRTIAVDRALPPG